MNQSIIVPDRYFDSLKRANLPLHDIEVGLKKILNSDFDPEHKLILYIEIFEAHLRRKSSTSSPTRKSFASSPTADKSLSPSNPLLPPPPPPLPSSADVFPHFTPSASKKESTPKKDTTTAIEKDAILSSLIDTLHKKNRQAVENLLNKIRNTPDLDWLPSLEITIKNKRLKGSNIFDILRSILKIINFNTTVKGELEVSHYLKSKISPNIRTRSVAKKKTSVLRNEKQKNIKKSLKIKKVLHPDESEEGNEWIKW